MTRTTTPAERLADFIAAHGYETANALRNQERHMREAAAEAARGAKLPPAEKQEAAEGFIRLDPTPGGYAHMAAMFEQAADRARDAAEAWEDLTEENEETEL